jgi:hypothetical protein
MKKTTCIFIALAISAAVTSARFTWGAFKQWRKQMNMKHKVWAGVGVMLALLVLGIAGCATNRFRIPKAGKDYMWLGDGGFRYSHNLSLIIATDIVSAETTSMLLLGDLRLLSDLLGPDVNAITGFNREQVWWPGENPQEDGVYSNTCVIIPSGENVIMNPPWIGWVGMNCEPNRVYYIHASGYDERRQRKFLDVTDSSDFSEVKKLYESAIASYATAQQSGGLQGALDRVARSLMASLNTQHNVAIVGVSSTDRDMADYVMEALEVILVQNRYMLVDRSALDEIRNEQRLQLSGDVDDDTAVSIGRFAGARIVIVGNISGTGVTRRLRLRALDTQTARIIGAALEQF